jgi:type IV secretion system protein VirD4
MTPRVKVSGEYSYQENRGLSLGHFIKGLAGFAFVVFGTSAVTTQYMAQALSYAKALGEPYVFMGRSFYSPLRAYVWVYRLLASGSRSTFTLTWAAFLLLGLFFGTAILVFSFFAQSRGTLSNVHGSARWAKKEDLINAGLLPRKGAEASEVSVYTGGWYDAKQQELLYLTHGGPEHVRPYRAVLHCL